MGRTITVEHGGKTYGGQVGTIESTTFGTTDHGIVTAMLHVKFDGGGIGVGGMVLDTPRKDEVGKSLGREGSAYGLDLLMWIMRTVGVDRWEKLPGKQVIVLFDGGRSSYLGSTSVGIAHITDEREVLILDDHAKTWREREEAAR
ncbi:hypothetical protein DNL40_02565 [Xylanimonas oleitrophica]|uniref:Uncharacterized protein n=1 Tax=Xylanimonas oleitrophica TaxID=2607479 RepID=A0A2W5WX73_9MICO|nr:hypothetical protein [Xylanimonas oleitrophica]PZR55273.1 hypothetical protein DNL40_02565 [Xylanimonas oleitrophica]